MIKEPSKKVHWAKQNERGNGLVLNITRLLAQYCPLWLLRPIVFMVVAYYYVTSPKARENIQVYQDNLQKTFPDLKKHLAANGSIFRQFYEFAMAIVDRFSVWQGKIVYEDLVIHDEDHLYQDMDEPKANAIGQVFICSHLGNIDICRALVKKHPNFILNVLIHSAHAVKFNEALNKAGASRIRLIQVTELDAEIMMQLNERIQRGEWLAIAADRVPVRGEKTIAAEFLGQLANWPQGPWLMVGLLKAPVNTLFCLKENKKYHLYLRRFAENISWTRQSREQSMANCVNEYAAILAKYCHKTPWQWFNFYQFWNDHDSKK